MFVFIVLYGIPRNQSRQATAIDLAFLHVDSSDLEESLIDLRPDWIKVVDITVQWHQKQFASGGLMPAQNAVKIFLMCPNFLPERDYVTFGSLPSQFRLVCLSSVTLVHPTQEVEAFGNISSPL